MCLPSSPKAPEAPAKLPEAARAAVAPTQAGAGTSQRRRKSSRSGTLVTGPRGLSEPASTTRRTLLGQ